ncbi:MAG: molybdopterin-guanine dinucleotide biosynthesis protein B [Pseudomonadota bacterium]
MAEQRLFGVTGWKNSGKTTLVCEIVAELSRRGFRVSTLKHAHKTFDIDHEGRDSYRHREAGASEVAVISQNRWALVHELRQEPEPPLQEILEKLSPVDLVIIEGFKREPHPKIECRRVDARSHEEIAASDPSIVALATDHPVESTLPHFDINDISSIADFVLDHTGLRRKTVSEKAS